MSCSTLAPTGLVYVCTVQVLFLSRRVSIAPHPPFPCTVQMLLSSRSARIAPLPPPPFLGGGSGCNWDCVLSLHVAGGDRSVKLCVVALRGNRGSGCATRSPSHIDVVLHPGSHRVGVCLYSTGVILVEACEHSPTPPISLYCTGVIIVEERAHSPPPFLGGGGSGCNWDCVLSLHVAGGDRSVKLCVVALRGNRGPGCATCSPSHIDVVLHPGSHRVGVCLYSTGVILVEACEHSPPPPISLYCTGVCYYRRGARA